MPEIFFPSQTLSSQDLLGTHNPILANLAGNNALGCDRLTANMPYCLTQAGIHPESKIITHTLSNMPEAARNNLMCTIDTLGDLTPALAAVYDKHLSFFNLQNSVGLVGAGATSVETRLNDFQKALKRYQDSLEAIHKHKGVGRGPSANLGALKAKARAAYDDLQIKFHAELKKVATPGSLGKNRGNALASADRGILLAQRRGRHINVASNAQAQQISRFAKTVSYAGNGMIALDAGIRIKGVHNTYKQGGNWQREAAIQTAGFGAAGAAGLYVGAQVVSGLTAIGLALTPVGWVVLIGIGLTAAFGAAYIADKTFQNRAAYIYDRGWR